MDRKQFITTSILMGTSASVTSQVFAQSIQESGLDKLTDAAGNYALQPLPFTESGLEPAMDQETVHLHYTFHHGDAVKAANNDLKMILQSLDANTLDVVDYWTRKLSYHLSSHILHTIFWTNLSKNPLQPSKELMQQISRDFGTFDRLKSLLAKTSKGGDGNGWGILGYQPFTKQLTVLQCENHEKLTQWGVIPLLVMDVWEHSYYLKFRNRRGEFVDQLFAIINWDNVSHRFEIAKKLA